MPIKLDNLLNLAVPPIEQTLNARDIILYALGVGLGADPMDEAQLAFVYEKNLQMLPSMAIVLCYPGSVFDHGDTGVTRTHVVHGEQGFEIYRPLPVSGTLVGRIKVVDVQDKGAGKGVLVMTEQTVHEKAGDKLICKLTSTTFCRADGGFGGPPGTRARPAEPPERAPDIVCDLATLPQAALIYRLSGDWNPLHAEPAYAKAGGFDRPILHGRCTFGVASHAILARCCNYDPRRLAAMQGRFSAPVYPGETIRTEIWRLPQAGELAYRASVPARGVTVISNGRARIVV